MTDTAGRDALNDRDRVFLEKLRLATDVLLELDEDPGTVNTILVTELHLFRDRVDRALLLPGSA